jgi:membrane protein
MTVVFAILSAFPVADRMGEAMRDFVFQNFVPASGVIVQEYLEEFTSKASRLSGASFVLLVLVALMMMTNIERALNRIWDTRRKRAPVSRFLVYWAMLSFGPALLAVSLAATSYLVSLPFIQEAEQSYGLGKRLLFMMPVLASWAAFTLMYVILPNHRTPMRYALIGGLVGALLFAVANRAFGWFVTSFANYEAIYGALAVKSWTQ